MHTEILVAQKLMHIVDSYIATTILVIAHKVEFVEYQHGIQFCISRLWA